MAIYGSPIPNIHVSLWAHLRSLSYQICKPWLVLGDFNEITMASEFKGGARVSSRANAFHDCLDDCSLIDMSAMGGFYMRKRCVQGQHLMLKHLDRVVLIFLGDFNSQVFVLKFFQTFILIIACYFSGVLVFLV